MRRAVDKFGQTIVMVTHDANAAAARSGALFERRQDCSRHVRTDRRAHSRHDEIDRG